MRHPFYREKSRKQNSHLPFSLQHKPFLLWQALVLVIEHLSIRFRPPSLHYQDFFSLQIWQGFSFRRHPWWWQSHCDSHEGILHLNLIGKPKKSHKVWCPTLKIWSILVKESWLILFFLTCCWSGHYWQYFTIIVGGDRIFRAILV